MVDAQGVCCQAEEEAGAILYEVADGVNCKKWHGMHQFIKGLRGPNSKPAVEWPNTLHSTDDPVADEY